MPHFLDSPSLSSPSLRPPPSFLFPLTKRSYYQTLAALKLNSTSFLSSARSVRGTGHKQPYPVTIFKGFKSQWKLLLCFPRSLAVWRLWSIWAHCRSVPLSGSPFLWFSGSQIFLVTSRGTLPTPHTHSLLFPSPPVIWLTWNLQMLTSHLQKKNTPQHNAAQNDCHLRLRFCRPGVQKDHQGASIYTVCSHSMKSWDCISSEGLRKLLLTLLVAGTREATFLTCLLGQIF